MSDPTEHRSPPSRAMYITGMLLFVVGFSIIENWARVYPWVYWIGLLLFGVGVSRLINCYTTADYEFGLTTVELASFSRRMFARVIDYSLYLIPGYFITVAFGLADQAQVERDLDKIFDLGANGMAIRFLWLFASLMILGLTVLVLNSVLQGRWGITLGKWICGIRTVRTTLRPSGIARALLRELLLVVDVMMGTSMIPATLLIAFTRCRQRVGDLIADTIVVRKRKPLPVTEGGSERAGLGNL